MQPATHSLIIFAKDEREALTKAGKLAKRKECRLESVIEVIDVYALWNKRVSSEDWSYNKGYIKGENPKMEADNSIPFPNFGVEVKF